MKLKVVFNFMRLSWFSRGIVGVGLLLGGVACGADASAPAPSSEAAVSVAKDYVTVAHAAYRDALAGAEALQAAVEAFAKTPDQAHLEDARRAWLASRDAYGRTEVFRFFDGPVDGEDGPEGRINGWPLDEQFLDGTVDAPTSGIVNMPAQFPVVDLALVREQNEKGGEKNISCGYHAIEFLLWGQDRSETGPGARPATDFLEGSGATAANGGRRLAYLRAASQLLVEDLRGVVTAWDPAAAGSYGATFADAAADVVLTRILQGMAALAGIELARERLGNAYETQDQEEEHSCFSDNTLADLLANTKGIEDVYLGRHGAFAGTSLSSLTAGKDAALDRKTRDALTAAVAAVEAIPAPFDRAIHDDATGRPRIKAAIDAEKALTSALLEVAALHGARVFLK